MTNSQERDWEKPLATLLGRYLKGTTLVELVTARENIELFIDRLLSEQKQQMVEKVEGMKKTKCFYSNHTVVTKYCEDCIEKEAYNQALEDLLAELKK